jgi:hypothetical protein
MSSVPQKVTRSRCTIHRSGSTSHKSGSAGIFTFTPVKTRRGKTTYEEVPALVYYRAASSDEEETPRRKKIKTPGGGAGASNLAHEFAQFIDDNYSGQHQGVSPVRWKTKVNDPSFFSPSEHSNPIKDSE